MRKNELATLNEASIASEGSLTMTIIISQSTSLSTLNSQHAEIQHHLKQLEQRSHFFIVILGTLIGASIALCIGYHLNANIFNYAVLMALPIALTYILRKVYIHTLVHSQLFDPEDDYQLCSQTES